MFKELKTGHKVPPTRYFYRTLCIIPAGTGFCICNETLHISNATEDQHIFKMGVASPTPAPPPVIVAPPVDDATKQQMLGALSEQSGMNLEWSRKCLEETQWDFGRAVTAFQEAQKKGLIPNTAFVK